MSLSSMQTENLTDLNRHAVLSDQWMQAGTTSQRYAASFIQTLELSVLDHMTDQQHQRCR